MNNKIEYVSPELEVTVVDDDILTFSIGENEDTDFLPGMDGADDNG